MAATVIPSIVRIHTPTGAALSTTLTPVATATQPWLMDLMAAWVEQTGTTPTPEPTVEPRLQPDLMEVEVPRAPTTLTPAPTELHVRDTTDTPSGERQPFLAAAAGQRAGM